MKAIEVDHFGGPEVLQIKDLPRPGINTDEVLVKVYASGVNPIDWKMTKGYMKRPLPFIPGWDMAGTVVETGSEVTEFKNGDEVYGRPDVSRNGSYAEYIAVRAKELGNKPRSVDFITAASIPLAGLTAWQALFEHGGLKKGQKILIQGGAGGVGMFAIQMAKWKGAQIIATSSADNLAFLKEMGAHEAVDYQQPGFEDHIRNLDMVLDTVGGDTQKKSLAMLKPEGILVTTVKIEDQKSFDDKRVRISGMMTRSNKKDLDQIAELVDSKQIKSVIAQVFTLEHAGDANKLSEQGHVRGKLVIQVREESHSN